MYCGPRYRTVSTNELDYCLANDTGTGSSNSFQMANSLNELSLSQKFSVPLPSNLLFNFPHRKEPMVSSRNYCKVIVNKRQICGKLPFMEPNIILSAQVANVVNPVSQAMTSLYHSVVLSLVSYSMRNMQWRTEPSGVLANFRSVFPSVAGVLLIATFRIEKFKQLK